MESTSTLKKITGLEDDLQALLTRMGLIEVTLQCPKHGEVQTYARSVETAYCPECKKEQEEQQRLIALAQHRWEQRFKTTNIGRRFAKSRLVDLKDLVNPTTGKSYYPWLASYVTHFSQNIAETGANIIFYGDIGTGKTHASCAIALELLRQGFSVHYDTVLRTLQMIRATWSANSEITTEQAIQRYVKPDLLVLDELGVQYNTDAERLLIFDIINRRSDDCLPMILISNHQLDGIKQLLGAPAYNRLAGHSSIVIKLEGKSRR